MSGCTSSFDCARRIDCQRFCPNHPLRYEAVDLRQSTIEQRLDELMRRMREEHYQPTYADLLAVRGQA